MTAADLARFYQALLHNPGGLWDAEVLDDATSNIRCTFTEPLLNVPVNRTLGLVVAGDDGNHILRYAIFGADNSPRSFGHAGAHAQVGWADPDTGISFAYLNNAVTGDMMRAGMRANRLATIAAALDLAGPPAGGRPTRSTSTTPPGNNITFPSRPGNAPSFIWAKGGRTTCATR